MSLDPRRCPAATDRERSDGPEPLPRRKAARYSAGIAGLLLLLAAWVLNLHILGLVERVTLEASSLLVQLPGLGAPVAVPLPHGRGLWVVVALALVGIGAAAVAGARAVARRWWLYDWLGVARQRRHGLAGLVVGFVLLAFGFLPVDLVRSLLAIDLYYLLAVPGFVFALYAAWPALHRFVTRISPRFERVVFESSALGFCSVLFSGTLLLTVGLSRLLFAEGPRIPTGIAHLFHARILASGSLFAEAPPLPEFFSLLTVVADSGRWYSIFPLGHTVLVAGALKLGVPWIVNPLCGAFAVVLFYLLGKELFGERTGRLAGLFGALSPFLVFMSSEFYNDASSLVFCTAFLLFFARAARTARLGDGLLAGLFLGLALNTRPVTAAAVCLPFVAYSLWLLLREPRRYAASLLGICVATLACVGLLLASNHGITGDPLTLGYAHADPVTEERAFDLSKALPNSVVRVQFLNRYLFQWAVPSLLPLALLFVAGRGTRWDYLLLSLLPVGLLAYATWYHVGLELGPRYLYFATGALVILAARGVQAAPGFVQEAFGGRSPLATSRTGVATVVFACFLSAAVLNWVPMGMLYGSAGWWGLDRSAVELVHSEGVERALVFVPDQQFRSLFLENAIPVDEGDVIYARDLGDRNAELIARFPDRSYFRLENGELVILDLRAPGP